MDPSQMYMASQANLLNTVTQGDAVDPSQQPQPQGILQQADEWRRRKLGSPTMQGSMGGSAPHSPIGQHVQFAKQQANMGGNPYVTQGGATAQELQSGEYGKSAATDKAAQQADAWAKMGVGGGDSIAAPQQSGGAMQQPASASPWSYQSAPPVPSGTSDSEVAGKMAATAQDPNALAQARWRQGEIAAAGGDPNAVQMIRGNNVSWAHAGGQETASGEAWNGGDQSQAPARGSDDDANFYSQAKAAGMTPAEAFKMQQERQWRQQDQAAKPAKGEDWQKENAQDIFAYNHLDGLIKESRPNDPTLPALKQQRDAIFQRLTGNGQQAAPQASNQQFDQASIPHHAPSPGASIRQSPDKAADILRAAGGDPKKAAAMAEAAGWKVE